MRILAMIAASALGLGAATCSKSEAINPFEEGQQIYRTAVRSDGSAVRAMAQNDVPLPPQAAACANCHRRSGYGISEGGSRSLNITATMLFSATEKPPLRPAYDDRLLIRAITGGIAADGRTLHPNMPRYQLRPGDDVALVSYLRSLGTKPSNGVSDVEISIATIVAANGPAEEREAVIRVLKRYVETKNAESRRESGRATASSRHFYGRTRQRAFRTWRLDVWDLDGSPSTWRRQLDAYNSAGEPFAIVSGTAGTDWDVVHQFCEANEIPCVLPLSDAPSSADTGFYSLYFSSGAVLEGNVIAKHIVQTYVAGPTNILVVHKDDEKSQEVYSAISVALHDNGRRSVESLVVNADVSTRQWQSILQARTVDLLIALLPSQSISSLNDLVASSPDVSPDMVYTTHAFTDWLTAEFTASNLASRIRHIYPYSLPVPGNAQFPREYLWLKQHGLSQLEPASASKVLYAGRMLGMALADMQSVFSREYLLETLEHALDGTQLTTVFPRISLGPDQRLLSRGAYVTNVTGNGTLPFINPVWIQQ